MMLRASLRPAAAAVGAVLPFTTALATDPYPDRVVLYETGTGHNPAYVDPDTALGAPERFTGEGVFPGVVSAFNPAFGTDELVSLGRGGVLVLEFDEPVEDDPANPFGIDLIVFGNTGFIDSAFPEGIVGGLFGADGGAVEVSDDGTTWTAIAGAAADGPFPTIGYQDSGPFDTVPGSVETDFTRPVDPGLTPDDFAGLDNEAVVDLYDGSGGGMGIDLAGTGLASIRFVRITNAPDAKTDIEVEALSDVAPVVTGDVTGDGAVGFDDILAVIAAWGPCPAPCPADLSGNGAVGFEDVLIVIGSWS